MKLVIIDDDPLVTLSLKTILEAQGMEVLALGQDGSDALPLYKKWRPDILLTDIRMKEQTGIEGAKQVLSCFPDARILFLTTFSDDDYIIEALSIGAKGYILKQDFENITPALKAVQSGQNVFGSEIAVRLPTLVQDKDTINLTGYDISEKELDIIKLVAEGMNNKEIAESLYLSEGTVRNYISTILDKLSLRDRTQLAVFYYKAGGMG